MKPGERTAQDKPEDGSIDAGLLVLAATTPAGHTRTIGEIAYVCGCSKGNIWLIEQRAMRKLRRAFERRQARELLKLL